MLGVLKPSEFYQAKQREPSIRETHLAAFPALLEEYVKSPVKSNVVSFQTALLPIFSLPNYIVFSQVINKYVSVKIELESAIMAAVNFETNRTFYSIDDYQAIRNPNLILIYVSDRVDDLALVSDVTSVCRPDFVLNCLISSKDEIEPGLTRVSTLKNKLNPAIGALDIIMCSRGKNRSNMLKSDDTIVVSKFGLDSMQPVVNLLG